MTSEPTATGLYAQHQYAPGTVLAGRFRIEAMLGIGGMGVVYRATDTALNVPVALKLLRPELAARPDAFERFRQELLMARQVSSPRVVRIHDIAQHDGQWLISMDFIDGEGLDRKLDRDGALPPDTAAGIARQLAEGLAAAHARGVIHRDLKPANVLIDREGHAYISDFGVARSLAGTGLTQSGAVVGTPDYLSPEQARGDAIDGRSDLYSLGLILYEMLTGAMPFQGGTLGEILAQRMLRSPPPVTQAKPQTPAWLARLTDRLLRVQPAHRLPTADAVMRAIDTREVPRDYGSLRKPVLIAALVVAVLGAGGYAYWRYAHPPTPAGIAAVAPLHRVLVMPLAARGDALGEDRATALSALLRTALQATPGTAVVDDERTYQALRQLDPSGALTVDVPALQRIVGADRVLQLDLRPHGKAWQASARLRVQGKEATVVTATATQPAAAFAQLASSPALAQALGVRGAALPFALPCGEPCASQSLAAFGAALIAKQRNAPANGLSDVRKATAQAPGFAPAWLLQAELAQAVGEADAAYEAIEAGQHSAESAPWAPLRSRFDAERALLDGDAPAAVAQWRTRLQQTPDDTFAELSLARALGAGGDFKAAIASLQKLVARDPNDPRAWFELGKFSILAGDAQRAVDEHLVRALVLYKRSGNRYGEAETANALGIGYARLGQTADAEKQYREAVQLRRAVGNRRGLATSLRNLGNILSQQGKFDEAANVLKQSGELHAVLGDRGGLAAVENELGILAEERGDYPTALTHFRSALQTWQQLGETAGTAQALNDIGFAHYQLGAYDDAQAYLVQSANAYRELGDQTGVIRTQQNLGLLAIARGQWNEAREQLEGSLAAAEKQQMLEEAAVSRRNLAELELQQGHLDSAIAQSSQAETLFREREDWRGLADAGLLRVQALLAAHADAEARKALDALREPITQASAEQQGIAALLRAELAERGGNAAEASRQIAQARQLARASGVKQLQLQVALHTAAPHQTRMGVDLKHDTAALGNVPLRLRYLMTAMRAASANDDAKKLQTAYREAAPLLRRGDYLDAWQLHELARGHCVDSAGQASKACGAAADTALARLRSRLPAPLRNGFDRAVPKPAQTPPVAGAQGG